MLRRLNSPAPASSARGMVAQAAPGAQSQGRVLMESWAGTYKSDTSVFSVRSDAGALTATEQWATGGRHGSTNWSACQVTGNTARCKWTGTYEGDPDKSATRSGTLEAKLIGDTISGQYSEDDEPRFTWHVAPYSSGMHKGAIWPFTATRK